MLRSLFHSARSSTIHKSEIYSQYRWAHAEKAFGYELDDPGSIPGVGDFSSVLRVQTDPGVLSLL